MQGQRNPGAVRWLVLLLVVPLSGCFGFSVEDDMEVPAPPIIPTVRAQITVVDTIGQAISNATVIIATHNITFQSGDDPDGVIVNLTLGPVSFFARHPNYLDQQIGLELTNESGDVKVQLMMNRDIDFWSKAERDVVSMVIDCSLGVTACPNSSGTGSVTVEVSTRADMVAIALHDASEVDLTIELLNGSTVVWTTPLAGPGPVGLVDLPGVMADSLRITAAPREATVEETVNAEYVVARCVTPPDGWSLIDPTGWDPRTGVPCPL